MCKGLADSLRQPKAEGLPPIIAFCQGQLNDCSDFAARLGKEVPLLFAGAEKVAALYRVSGFPTAVVVDSEQKIRGYGHPADVEDLSRLAAGGPTESSSKAEVSAAQSS